MPKRKRSSLSLTRKAGKALKEAVRRVIEDHSRTGAPLWVWQNGRVAKVSANRLLHRI